LGIARSREIHITDLDVLRFAICGNFHCYSGVVVQISTSAIELSQALERVAGEKVAKPF